MLIGRELGFGLGDTARPTYGRSGALDNRQQGQDVGRLERGRASAGSRSLGLFGLFRLGGTVDSLGLSKVLVRSSSIVFALVQLERDTGSQLSKQLGLAHVFDKVRGVEVPSESLGDLVNDLSLNRLRGHTGVCGRGSVLEVERVVDGDWLGVLVSSQQAVEEVGDRVGAVLGLKTVNETSQDVLAGTEHHLLLNDSLIASDRYSVA